MEIEQITQEALKQWGSEAQLNMVIEECAELIDAIQKWRRDRITSFEVLGEAVDVEIMLEQLRIMLNNPVLWENIKRDKLNRLANLLGKEILK